MDLDKHPFSVRRCVEEVLDLVSQSAIAKNIELTCLVEEGVPEWIVGDVSRLRQILVNLVGNAVKFTDRGEVIVTVSPPSDATTEIKHILEKGDRSVQLHFSVRDTGIGIAAEKLPRLFKAFSQADSSTTRRYGGTGLGLAICKRLVELMGGTIGVKSQPGFGSTFYFTIDTQTEPASATHGKQHQQDNALLQDKRLLIVDDNATNRRALQCQTQHWNMLPELAEGPNEAIQLLTPNKTFDLAIIDMHMPEMDGVQLALKIRSTCSNEHLPMILLTSAGHGNLSRSELAEAFDAVLTKPLHQEDLRNAVLQIFRKHPAEATPSPPSKIENNPSPTRIYSEEFATQYPLRILLAEDNPINQRVALLMLSKFGYRADAVASGLETVEAVKRRPYDVILMDVSMPEMDGYEATRNIRHLEQTTSIPSLRKNKHIQIIALTASVLQNDRDLSYSAGMDNFLTKPMNPAQLIQALTQAHALLHPSAATNKTRDP